MKNKEIAKIVIVVLLGSASIPALSMWIDSLKATERVYYIRTCQDVIDIKNDLGGTYILMNDIDFKECNYDNAM